MGVKSTATREKLNLVWWDRIFATNGNIIKKKERVKLERETKPKKNLVSEKTEVKKKETKSRKKGRK
jgi:hypothetical protein